MKFIKLIEKLKRVYRLYLRKPPKFKITTKASSERHGSIYGGWHILKDSLSAQSIVYSFGVGKDISFDKSIIDKYQCKLFAFDPTPEVIKWVNNQEIDSKFIFKPIAVSNKNGYLNFFAPTNENHISHRSRPSSETGGQSIEVPCFNLASIMKKLGHNHIDLLKMDIEGAEYEVLDNIIFSGIKIDQLVVEFHHFFSEYSNYETEKYIEKLEAHNYRLFKVSDSFCEYSFKLNKNESTD